MISQVKIRKYDLNELSKTLRMAAEQTEEFSGAKSWKEHENENDCLLNTINEKYYPNPEFKFLIAHLRDFEGRIENEVTKLSGVESTDREETIEEVLSRHKDEILTLEKEITGLTNRNTSAFQFQINRENAENLGNEFTDRYAEVVLKELSSKIPHQKQTKLNVPEVEPFANSPFLSRWFTERQRAEMQYYMKQISHEDDPKIQDVMKVVLSRTVRSCRATTHIDLATLIKPQSQPYYCRKHFKICRPVTTIIRHLKRYTEDTIERIREFDSRRKTAFCEVINDDSRTANIFNYVAEKNEDFWRILKEKKIDGIFTSPPYVGQIDYHEQHAYAYELFNIERKDDSEIGKQSNGTGKRAQADYIAGISAVLLNVKRFLKKDAPIFIVANDSKNLYPQIAEASGLKINKIFRRPVLNRTERDKQPYSESIFQMMFA